MTLDGSVLYVDYFEGGGIELGGVVGAGTIGLDVDGNNLRLSFPDDVTRADVSITNGTLIDVVAEDGGSVAINARNLDISGESSVRAGIGQQLGAVGSQAGDIEINTTGAVTVAGSYIFNIVGSGAVGNSGNINITAESLSITDGAQVQTLVRGASFDGTLPGGQGNAGNVNIDVTDTVSFDGGKSYGQELGAYQEQNRDDPEQGIEQGLYLDGSYRWFSGAYTSVEGTSSKGEGGNIIITTGSLSVTDGAQLSARSIGNGTAGNIEVKEASSIRLDNNALLIANTRVGQGGNILLDSEDLVLRRGSNITTNATGTATGGNVTIDTDIIAALEDSDISANAEEAFGGRVIIDAQGIFGTEFRERENPATSDITATSELGPEFSGTVEINTPDIDPSSGLVDLPAVPVDTELAQGCTEGSPLARSEFMITGRGGLPPNPGDALNTDAVQVDLM